MTIRRIAVAVILGLTAVSTAAQAAEQTVILNVANATCALCGPIVKGTLQRVPGVETVTIDEANAFSGAVATVRFDDQITNVAALVAATANAGYSSKPQQ